jgi:hypothetical protein
VVAVVVECDIEVDNVTVFESTLVGDAVAYNFVNGCAERLREVVIVQRGWV